MNNQILLPDFNPGAAASGTAICDLTAEVAGKVLESILVVMGGGAFVRANIVAWRLKGDGKTLREGTGADTNTIYSYYGRANAVTELMIDFMAPWARTPDALCAGAWDLNYQLSGVNRITLEVDISGATTPTIKAYAELSPSVDIPSERPFRWMMLREHRAPVVISGAGEVNISSMIPHFQPQADGSVFRAIHLFGASMTDMRVRKEGRDVFKGPVANWQAWQKRAGRVPQSNHLAFDPGLDNLLRDRIFDTTKYTAAKLDEAKRAANVRDQILPGVGSCTSADLFITVSGGVTLTAHTQELVRVNEF